MPTPETPWMDIATAPKDGTKVLLSWAHFGIDVMMGMWCPESTDGDYHAAGWYCWGPVVCGFCVDPTHWHPLPPPPPEATP